MKTTRNFFENIADYKALTDDKQTEISAKMYQLLYKTFTHKKIELNPCEYLSLEELNERIVPAEHYVSDCHNFFVGKKFVNKGQVIQTTLNHLIDFMKKEKELSEEMAFICMPCSENPPYIFVNNEDWGIYFVSLNK